jgi:hypothetical protein
MSSADHELAQEYVRSVLNQDDPAPEPIQQDLSPEEQAFLEQALEKMIAKERDRMEREYVMEDEINGIWYRGRFKLERIPDK